MKPTPINLTFPVIFCPSIIEYGEGLYTVLIRLQTYIRGVMHYSRCLSREREGSLDWMLSDDLRNRRFTEVQCLLSCLEDLGYIDNETYWHIWSVVCSTAHRIETRRV